MKIWYLKCFIVCLSILVTIISNIYVNKLVACNKVETVKEVVKGSKVVIKAGITFSVIALLGFVISSYVSCPILETLAIPRNNVKSSVNLIDTINDYNLVFEDMRIDMSKALQEYKNNELNASDYLVKHNKLRNTDDIMLGKEAIIRIYQDIGIAATSLAEVDNRDVGISEYVDACCEIQDSILKLEKQVLLVYVTLEGVLRFSTYASIALVLYGFGVYLHIMLKHWKVLSKEVVDE